MINEAVRKPMEYSVTFETKCYEKDWEILLKTSRLEHALQYNNYPFEERILYINNVIDLKEVCKYAERLVNQGILTSYIVVEDHSKQALDFFNIKKEEFRGGYYYSIQELVGIYLCKTPYLLHFSSDSILEHPLNWIKPSLQMLENNPKIKVANPVWNGLYNEAKNESFAENENFYIGYGFSDQCYLIAVKDFKAQIYNEYNEASQRYPQYGGELFEKRVDAWMRNHCYFRVTYKFGSYIHKNFSL
ncbi:hypothetical protein [Sporomusa carbonis]|uniref:hypothetical protein n=1 Tax=Sporomusa carbonis TaxID=3076075 RepID=UPI003C7C4F3F